MSNYVQRIVTNSYRVKRFLNVAALKAALYDLTCKN